MNKTMLKQIQAHAAAEFPKESCGVVIREAGRLKYVPCRNDAKTPSEHFIINPEDKCDAEDRGEVIMIIHSHPDVPPVPSMTDRVSCELHEKPWGSVPAHPYPRSPPGSGVNTSWCRGFGEAETPTPIENPPLPWRRERGAGG